MISFDEGAGDPANQLGNRNAPGEDTEEQRRHGGHFFRRLLRKVKPEHIPKMIDMLGKFEKGGKEILVPDGRWWMPMPHGYILIGQGPIGVAIERDFDSDAEGSGEGDRLNAAVRRALAATVSERDTQRILRLCKDVLTAEDSKRDLIIAQLYGLDFEKCVPEAIGLATWELVVNGSQ